MHDNDKLQIFLMFNFNTFILTHVVGYLNQQTPYASEERS